MPRTALIPSSWENVRSSLNRVGDLMAIEPTIRLGPDHAVDSPNSNGGLREPDWDIGIATKGWKRSRGWPVLDGSYFIPGLQDQMVRSLRSSVCSGARLVAQTGRINAGAASDDWVVVSIPFKALDFETQT